MSQSFCSSKNSIFESNLKFLQEYNEAIYKKVLNRSKNDKILDKKIEVVQTKNGLLNFSVIKGDKKYFVHSNYDPYKEGLIISDIEDDAFDTIMILGFGLGYHVEQIIKRFPDRNKYIIEPDTDIFIKCLETQDIRDILKSKNTSIMLSDNNIEVYNEIAYLYRRSLIYSLKFVQLGSYNSGAYGEMWKNIQADFLKFMNTHVVNIRTILLFNVMWLYNFFMNLKHLDSTAILNDFENKFQSIPAILVSAGPSLDENIHFLKGLEDKALILASGSAVTSLLRNGIIPHIAIGIDGGKTMSDVFNDIDRDDIMLTFVPNLHYDCVNKYKGPRLYIRSTSEPHVDYFERFIGLKTNGISAGGSVSNVALDLLCKLGCDPIVFIGQDLALTGMKTHAEGNLESLSYKDNLKTLEEEKRFIKTIDMNGNDIYTTQVLLSMKYWFDNYLTVLKGKRTFINATAVGLKLENTVRMEMTEVLEKYCNTSISIRSKIFDIFEESVKNNNIDKDKIKCFISDVNETAKKCKGYSEKRVKMCERVLKDIEKGLNKNYPAKIKDINKITLKLENKEFYKAFILARCTDMNLAYKNNAEQQAMEATTVNAKLKILYTGLLSQFKDIDEKINAISKIAEEVLKEYESEA